MKRFRGLLKKDFKVAWRNYYLLIVIITAAIFVGLINFVIPKELNTNVKIVYSLAADELGLLGLDQFLQMSPENEKVGTWEQIIEMMQEDRNTIGMMVKEKNGQPIIEMIFQGHESTQMKNALKITMRSILEASQLSQSDVETVVLRKATEEEIPFNLAMVPLLILLEPVMLGFILIAALIFMEKEEETAKAYLVSPGRIPEYLASKIILMMVLGLISTGLIALFTVGWSVDWGILFLLVIIGSIFGSALGLFIGSIFDTISKAMVWVIGLSMLLSLPQVSYFAPSFAPKYLTWMPTYSLMFALKEALFPAGNVGVVYSALVTTGIFGILLYLLSIVTYQRTLGRD